MSALPEPSGSALGGDLSGGLQAGPAVPFEEPPDNVADRGTALLDALVLLVNLQPNDTKGNSSATMEHPSAA